MRHSRNAVSFDLQKYSVTNLEQIRVTQTYSCDLHRSMSFIESKLQSYSYN